MNGSILIPILVLVAGCVLAMLVAGRREARPLDRVLVSVAWGPGLAAGILGLTSFFGLALGLGSAARPVLLAVLTVPIAALWWCTRADARLTDDRALDVADNGAAALAGWLAVVSLLLAHGWNFVVWLEHRPLGSFDAMAIWTYRAVEWYRAGVDFPAVIGALTESKPGYPLMLPGLVVSQLTLWGGETTVIPVATGWLFLVGLTAATVLAVARWAPLAAALAAAALLLSTPQVWRWSFAQCADLPLAYLTLAAAIGLVDRIERGRSAPTPAWLVGFFLGLMVWTKDEGLILVLSLVAAAIAALRVRRGSLDRSDPVGLLVGSLPALVATVTFKLGWIGSGELGRYLGAGLWHRLIDPGRWREIMAAFAGRLVPLSDQALWGGTLVLLVGLGLVTVVTRRTSGQPTAVLIYGLPVALALAVDVAIYLATPEPLGWHLRTSLDRLLLQLLPIAVVAVFVACGHRGGETPSTGRG
ncbi:MAG: hypothetical protein PVG53_14890 [Holophagae bacterium]|jgi:hypothetical protein